MRTTTTRLVAWPAERPMETILLMSRTAAKLTQSDIARSIRAAKQAGAALVELVLPGGTIRISLISTKVKSDDPDQEVVL